MNIFIISLRVYHLYCQYFQMIFKILTRIVITITIEVEVKVKSLSHVQLVVTPWTAAYQAPLSMGFYRQEY